MADQPDGYDGGVRLTSDDGDTLVFGEAVTKYSCLQVLFDAPEMEEGDWDIIISEAEMKQFVKGSSSSEPEFVDFEQRLWPENVEDALNDAMAERSPEAVNFWHRSGMQLQYLHAAVLMFKDLYGRNARIKIEQKDYKGAISFHVSLADDVPFEATFFITAFLMWDGE